MQKEERANSMIVEPPEYNREKVNIFVRIEVLKSAKRK